LGTSEPAAGLQPNQDVKRLTQGGAKSHTPPPRHVLRWPRVQTRTGGEKVSLRPSHLVPEL